MNKQEEDVILQNSIERVINNTLVILEQLRTKGHLSELININLQDWMELKWITVNLWNEKRNQIFKDRNK